MKHYSKFSIIPKSSQKFISFSITARISREIFSPSNWHADIDNNKSGSSIKLEGLEKVTKSRGKRVIGNDDSEWGWRKGGGGQSRE